MMRRLLLPSIALLLGGLPLISGAAAAQRGGAGLAKAAASAEGGEPGEDLDRLALAALMVRDRHWDRAAAVLAEVDAQDPELDRGRYFLLRGLVRVEQGDARGGAGDLRTALDAGDQDGLLWLQLSRAWLDAGDPGEAAAALADARVSAPELPETVGGYWLMLARAHQQGGASGEAWTALAEGRARFPELRELLRLQVLLLLEMKLYGEAAELGQGWLDGAGDEVEPWLVLAEAFRLSGDPDRALVLLEQARLRFPDDAGIPKQLAHGLLSLGRPYVAAMLLSDVAEQDATLWQPVAESWRRAGRTDRALEANAKVPDTAERTRQRLGILLEREDFERAVSLHARASRLGLLQDDGVAYGLAYARFRSGDLDGAERLLQQISDPRVFKLAIGLRQAMDSCREAPWECM